MMKTDQKFGAVFRIRASEADELEILYELAEIGMMRKIRERTFKLEEQDAQYAGFAVKIPNIADTSDQDRMISLLRRYFRTET